MCAHLPALGGRAVRVRDAAARREALRLLGPRLPEARQRRQRLAASFACASDAVCELEYKHSAVKSLRVQGNAAQGLARGRKRSEAQCGRCCGIYVGVHAKKANKLPSVF